MGEGERGWAGGQIKGKLKGILLGGQGNVGGMDFNAVDSQVT